MLINASEGYFENPCSQSEEIVATKWIYKRKPQFLAPLIKTETEMYSHRKKQKHSIRLTLSKSKSPTLSPVHLLRTFVYLEPSVLGILVNCWPGFTLSWAAKALRVAKLGHSLFLKHATHQAFLIGLLRTGLDKPQGWWEWGWILLVWTKMEIENLLLLGSPTFLSPWIYAWKSERKNLKLCFCPFPPLPPPVFTPQARRCRLCVYFLFLWVDSSSSGRTPGGQAVTLPSSSPLQPQGYI